MHLPDSVVRKITFVVAVILLVTLFCLTGCELGDKSKPENLPAAGHPEEIADSTRFDSASVDTVSDTL